VAGFILLSAAQMRAVEDAAIKGGVSSAALMEHAGEKVAEVSMRAWTQRPVAVLCGPGNNGGDGFVAARRLARAGWPVRVGLLGERKSLAGDAKMMADLYEGEITGFSPALLEDAGLIIDAIFGTGLARLVEGDYRAAIEAVNAHPAPALAVDIPSGVSADTGAVLGVGVKAARTVTFFQKKTGHVLFPGRALCGSVDVVEIGITSEAAAAIKPDSFENQPALWGSAFGRPAWQGHKYHRGHVMAVSGGALHTGAIRLAAMSALRMGAGLVTVLSPGEAVSTHAAHLTAIMLRRADTAEEIGENMQGADKYPMVGVIGPAAGLGKATRDKVLAILNSRASAVLDADALTSFADAPAPLFEVLRDGDVLTPHSGEFERLFNGIPLSEGKLAAARAASVRAGCIVVLKGADTVIAAPDGRAAINVNAPPDLATAGAGDVLAGLIAGLRAQGMPGFEAACAGVWFHGACAQAAGPGLIAEDLPDAVRPVLRALLSPPSGQNDPSKQQGGPA
jgi:ADP-dependent NAD(P)H-hydrate dehydratase / NAD(P)H-hydrate epimerase